MEKKDRKRLEKKMDKIIHDDPELQILESNPQKKFILDAAKRTLLEYGEVLKKLADE